MAGSFDCVGWNSNGHHIRVYVVTASGVVERWYDSDVWVDGTFAATGNTVGAAVSVSQNQAGLRVYVGDGSQVTEQSYDGVGWYQGDFVKPGVEATAIAWQGGWGGLIFVRSRDNKIAEYRKINGLWSSTGFSVDGIDFAATSLEGDGSRLYVVGSDHQITEYCSSGQSLVKGAFTAKGTDVAVVTWKDHLTQCLRVYVRGENGVITEQCWAGDGWYAGEFAVSGEEVAACGWVTGDGTRSGGAYVTHLRVYVRQSDNRIQEYYWDGDGWHGGAYTGPIVKTQ